MDQHLLEPLVEPFSLCYHTAMIVIEVTKHPNESNASILRRFSRRAQENGLVRKIRDARYRKRPASDFTKKKYILKSIERRIETIRLLKLGKPIKKKKGRR
jgi:ribosomal protein S21